MRRPHVEIFPPYFCIGSFSLAMAFFLIITFMFKWLAMPISSRYGSIPIVDNPKIEYYVDEGEDGPPPLVVSIDKNQRMFIQKRIVKTSQFYSELRNELLIQRKEYPTAHFIALNIDKHVPMANVYALIKTFKSLEIERIILIVSQRYSTIPKR